MRFLMLAADFAPRGASPAIRTVHLAKYLIRSGHEVDFVTYDEAAQTAHSPHDAGLTAKVPEAVRVVRVAPGFFHRTIMRAKSEGVDAGRLRQRGTNSRLSSLIIPDPHIAAVRAFVRAAREIAADRRPDVLLTFSYPFSMNIVGAWLRWKRYVPCWIADYGDPWTGGVFSEMSRPGWRRALDVKIERRLLGRADAVTMTTEPTRRLYETLFPMLAGRVHVVPMGYDGDDIDEITPRERTGEDRDKLLMIHTGRVWKARNPDPFIEAIASMATEDPGLGDRLKVVLLGEVDPETVESIAASPARSVIVIKERIPVRDCIAYMMSADIQLLFGNKGGIQIPGKLYEYIGVGRPIMLLQESEADPVVDILGEYGGGLVVPNETDAIVEAMQDALDGNHPGVNEGAADKFSWSAITARLIDAAESAMRLNGNNKPADGRS